MYYKGEPEDDDDEDDDDLLLVDFSEDNSFESFVVASSRVSAMPLFIWPCSRKLPNLLVKTSSAMPKRTLSSALKCWSRSIRRCTSSALRPVCFATMPTRRARVRSASAALMRMSLVVPLRPCDGWWSMTRAFGATRRLPCAPHDRIIAAMLHARPTATVRIGYDTTPMASTIASP